MIVELEHSGNKINCIVNINGEQLQVKLIHHCNLTKKEVKNVGEIACNIFRERTGLTPSKEG